MSAARPALAAAVLASAFGALHRRVLGTPQRAFWPPSPDAVTAAGAEVATDAFRARRGTGPRDATLEFAWSTAATIEPWADGEGRTRDERRDAVAGAGELTSPPRLVTAVRTL